MPGLSYSPRMTFMNQLQNENSPYLLQHADNPVHWHAWNEATLARAKVEDKPILLSIGFSTCHWCHVMERESFEDPDIAAFMNAYFINIKVDREERPDLDALYMDACQVITGSAGWPLNVFLTPELKPFYAGTYFPPEAGHKRMSWMQALQYVHYNFQVQRRVVEQEARRVMARMEKTARTGTHDQGSDAASTRTFPQLLFEGLQSSFDREAGGFGAGQKYPNTMALEFLLNYFYYSRDPEALRHFRFTVSTMLKSGIYDQIGGGIARYTVDRNWRIPHFEKMLYDNALFAQLLAKAYHLIGRRKYKTALQQTLAFLERDMLAPEGGFYAALDADSPQGEGRYYTWGKSEIEMILGEQADLFCTYFGITSEGNWDGTNILYQPLDRFQYADRLDQDREALLESIHAAGRKLLEERYRRMPLQRDEKIILGWNAMMVSTYVQAHLATGEALYLKLAQDLLNFLEITFLTPDGKALYRTYINGRATHPATLRDYAFLIRAYLNIFQITNKRSLLSRVEQLTRQVEADFLTKEGELYSYARLDLPDLIREVKDIVDDEMPSGNALMLRNLQDLAILTGDKKYRKQLTALLAAMSDRVLSQPLTYAAWANAYLADAEGVLEIALIGKEAESWKAALNAGYIPFKLMLASPQADESLPLLSGKSAPKGTRIYVCRDYVCQTPLESPETFAALYFKPPNLSQNQ